MSLGPNPRHDLPFPDDIIDYCSRRLLSLGIQPDRAWLKEGKPAILDALTGGDQSIQAAEARKSVPTSLAIWETREFYRWAVPLAIFDVRFDEMARFEHFELLYLRILGEEARPWLPSLYLAAIASPNVLDDHRVKCFDAFNSERLRTEQEAHDRQIRLYDDD